MPKRLLFFLFVVVFFAVVMIFWPKHPSEEKGKIVNSFEECAAAGYPIMESYPRLCMPPGGKQPFTETILPEK